MAWDMTRVYPFPLGFARSWLLIRTMPPVFIGSSTLVGIVQGCLSKRMEVISKSASSSRDSDASSDPLWPRASLPSSFGCSNLIAIRMVSSASSRYGYQKSGGTPRSASSSRDLDARLAPSRPRVYLSSSFGWFRSGMCLKHSREAKASQPK